MDRFNGKAPSMANCPTESFSSGMSRMRCSHVCESF